MKKYTLDEILENQETIEKCLHGSVILFPVGSEHYEYSGFCIVAALNGSYSEKGLLVIASLNRGWNTFNFSTKEELRTFLSCKPEICPANSTCDEDCYILE